MQHLDQSISRLARFIGYISKLHSVFQVGRWKKTWELQVNTNHLEIEAADVLWGWLEELSVFMNTFCFCIYVLCVWDALSCLVIGHILRFSLVWIQGWKAVFDFANWFLASKKIKRLKCINWSWHVNFDIYRAKRSRVKVVA